MEEKFFIIQLNTSHPATDHAFSIVTIKDGDLPLCFDTEKDANDFIQEEAWTEGPFVYAVMSTNIILENLV